MDRILAKLIANAMTLRKIAPSPAKPVGDLWDVPSMYALTRTLIESHDAFAYICIQPESEEIRTFRLQVWQQHADEQWLRLAKLQGQDQNLIEEMKTRADQGRAVLVTHLLFSTLNSDVQGKIRKGDAPMYVLPIEKRNDASGIDPQRYKAATMELSSYLHSHPSALHRLWSFVAGSDEALQMTTIAMRYATSFLARSILAARPLLGVPLTKEWSETEEMLGLRAAYMEQRSEKSPEVSLRASQGVLAR